MARFDRVIRGGMIVDGSRLPRFRGDIGIKDGVVAEIGVQLDQLAAFLPRALFGEPDQGGAVAVATLHFRPFAVRERSTRRVKVRLPPALSENVHRPLDRSCTPFWGSTPLNCIPLGSTSVRVMPEIVSNELFETRIRYVTVDPAFARDGPIFVTLRPPTDCWVTFAVDLRYDPMKIEFEFSSM